MVHNSQYTLSDDVLIRMYRLFFTVFSQFHNQNSFYELMDGLFSQAEKIMIAKRVGIIYLIIKKVDYRDIADVLKVSTSTIVHYATMYHLQENKIVKIIQNKLLKEKVVNFLDDLFADLYIQPGMRIGHYALKYAHETKKYKRKTLPV